MPTSSVTLSQRPETIFFSDCTFSFVIWSTIASRTNLHVSQNWVDTITKLRQLPRDNHGKKPSPASINFPISICDNRFNRQPDPEPYSEHKRFKTFVLQQL
ncbi:hypothetical protein IGI04_042842 [Brassica rapa subsp. trilocularis]|uniref:Uncharacterized protein n=1 Tax=Brassica rapa subsp. trilocularis TaxID=1813537 RepID=A0ABQ7KHE0_BRACM|nr:hypothetical protein IGI04_042834 [Brassica rapa subsp. trilocularis]KAG5373845.1 hypothetical protein IGI04_042838 [Brassica rapa subsp. trilocularis]KAG5373849.1 hypothetical protein IGI04_042842 [Brassica rapa subsp. trilocularis]